LPKALPQFLGRLRDREYYYDPAAGKFLWKVPEIREIICPPPGYVMISADYSQIEVKLMAFLSRDPFLITAINSGKDIHSFMASEVLGVDYDLIVEARKDKNHPRHLEMSNLRSATKCVTFGLPLSISARGTTQ